MSDEPEVGRKKRKLSDISAGLRKEEILEADGPLNLGERHNVPEGERRKLSEESKERLKEQVERVEGRLEQDYQRPIERHKEAESFVKTLPPWQAILAVIFGALMALTAIPSSVAFHKSSWSRQEQQLSVMTTPEEIESYPAGQNWRAFTLMLPFAIVAVGLTIWGRGHKLALLGLALYAFSLGETALMSWIYEWSDGGKRTAMAEAKREEVTKRRELERKQRDEEQKRLDEQRRRLAEQRKKLEEEKLQRRMADQEAARKEVYQRQMVEMEAAAKKERERRLREAEEKKEAERRRKEKEALEAQQAEEKRLAELEQARKLRAKRLAQARDLLANQNEVLDNLLKKVKDAKAWILAAEERIKANAAEEVELQKQIEEQDGIVRSCDMTIERAKKTSAQLSKIKAPVEERRKADDMARLAAKRKARTEKGIRALKSKISTLHSDTKRQDSQIARCNDELDKLDTQIEALETEIGETEAAIEELEDN